ncbi:hypothetical protein FLONG3_6522 [Fusarium longipes]|uniref:Uncharacterized protein n=1 Tax=Fusarium longipes TaxID=694270 RepID=A0A395SKC0_9HYPO|nr:hypothetical protein FLONG3_6522 [Fusarium longipes]
MKTKLFRILTIAAVFSIVLSAPVENTEDRVTHGQSNTTETNEVHVDTAHETATPVKEIDTMETDAGDVTVQQKCPRVEAPHISTGEKEGDIFARREGQCWFAQEEETTQGK